MRWNDKRYYALNTYLRSRHGEKVGKLSLSAGLTCPNRDGSLSTGGCIFCSEDGSGTFAGCPTSSIQEQIRAQKEVQRSKWPVNKYIAYFQSYTNTYGDPKKLEKLYLSALEDEEVCGVAIATRPDCLDMPILDVLEGLNNKTHLWVELGLQTIHARSARWMNRGYELSVFENALKNLKDRHIETVVHIIVGLPGESTEDILQTVRYLSCMGIDGIKIHLLHVIEGTTLHATYEREVFEILEMQAYIEITVQILENLAPNIVVHRLTGDGAKETLVAPRWPLRKRAVLNGIDKRLKELDTWQGRLFQEKDC